MRQPKLTTTCLTCGQSRTETLLWFKRLNFKCICGGKFDMKPLDQLAVTSAKKFTAAIKAFQRSRGID